MRLWALFVLALVVLVTTPVASQASDPDPREQQMTEQLGSTGVYLEPSPAKGDRALWRRRLVDGVRKADLGVPVKVALWTSAEGVWPGDLWTRDEAAILDALGLPRRTVALLGDQPARVRVETALPQGRVRDRVDASADRAAAVVKLLEEASPDPERYERLSSVARAWVFLRLVAADAPAPRKLVAQLSGDPDLFDDKATPPESPVQHDSTPEKLASPWAIGAITTVLVGTVLLFLRITWVANRASLAERVAAPRTADPMLDRLTRLSIEREVTDLAERVSASDVRPGDPAYDAAQSCLDAAAKYVDSERDRDRFGVHLLVADGRAALDGDDQRAKCYFHPLHTAVTSVKRRDTELPSCRRCAKEVSAGSEPGALLVADPDGTVRPYYETDDVWTATGYGAIDQRWARRVLLAALEDRR